MNEGIIVFSGTIVTGVIALGFMLTSYAFRRAMHANRSQPMRAAESMSPAQGALRAAHGTGAPR